MFSVRIFNWDLPSNHIFVLLSIGYKHIIKANESKAIDTLLVTDELFRSSDISTREQYVKLTESVKENGGTVSIFSTLHVTGEQLSQLSGDFRNTLLVCLCVCMCVCVCYFHVCILYLFFSILIYCLKT